MRLSGAGKERFGGGRGDLPLSPHNPTRPPVAFGFKRKPEKSRGARFAIHMTYIGCSRGS